jgi:amidase
VENCIMHYETAGHVVAAMEAGAITSVELVDMLIARIEALDPRLNAIVVRDFDRARQAARAADDTRAKGDRRPLLGLPVTVKEAIDVAGLPTTWGLPGTQDARAARDAVVVQRLKAAGAIILGKTNVPVMLADWQTANPVYGVTNNPWDTSRTCGGSSGGAAAALASGTTFLELGSDLAGSLRIPASFCGVLAHRPSHGLIPMRGFAPPGAPREDIMPGIDQAVLGPMARSVSDLILAFAVVAGADDADAAWELRLPAPRAAALDGFRVLIVDEHPLVPTADAIRSALSTLGTTLEQAGCTVGRQSPSLPDLRELSTLFIELLMAFSGADMPPKEYESAVEVARSVGAASRDFATAAVRGTAMTHRDWIQADRRRFALAAQWRRLFQEWDVVLCPTAPTVAFTHDQREFEKRTLTIDGQSMPYRLLPLWTAWPTPTGQPVTTIPIGLDKQGLPIGVQIIGPRLEDRTTLAFAGMVERLTDGFASPPL